MGNLQSEPKSKIKKKLGKKKGKHEGTEEHFTSLVSEQQTPDKTESLSISTCKKPTDSEPPQNTNETLINYSQNRSYLNKFTDDKIDTPQSSSESYFTDPLTPITQNEKTAETTSQQNFLHDLTLNSFKLNEHRARHEEEKSKKLSKLGVSKTSQISLESDPFECFMTDNVEIISQIQCDSDREALLDNDESFERPQTLMKQENDPFSGTKMSESSDHGIPEYKRNMSVPLDISEIESCVKLKKASSFSLSRTELDSKITKPKFVPEKLDFQLYQKFEGYMLVNWYLSEFTEKNLISDKISHHDLKLVAIQFCTHLLAAGVLKQLPDKDVPVYNIFKPDCMYFWTHSEAPAAVPQTPGRLSKVFWPPTSPLENFSPSSCNEAMFTISPEEVNVRKQEMRNSTRDVEILLLEEEIKRLKQEIEKYKTLDEIQTLTKNAVIDFSSPVESLNIEEKFAERVEQVKVDTTTQTEFQEFDLNQVCGNVENTNIDITTQTELKEFVSRSSSYDEMKKSSSLIQAPGLQFSTISPTPVSTSQSSFPPSPSSFPPPPPPLPPPLFSPSLSSTVPTPPIPPPFPPPLSSGSHPPPAPLMSAVPPPPPAPPMFAIPPPPPAPLMFGIPPPPPPPSSSAIPPPPGMPYTAHTSDNSGSKEPMPLPPPPIGGWNAQKAALKKPAVAPKVPMKPLYWTRIVATLNETESPRPGSALWKEINEISLNELSDFEELFSRQVVTKKPSVKKQLPTSKATAVKLLDSKRSQNVGILAQSLKIDLQEIENAVYNFDTSIVGLETLQQIYEARATREELELIKSHIRTLPTIQLDKPEQFLYELAEISNFAERISCLMFQVEFDDSINTIGHTLANFKTTCDFLTNNVELKEVIAIILTLGNYMNGGNISRGQADGFGLEILSKLRDVKSNDSKITLLHYVVKVYMRNIQHPIETNLRLPVPEPGDIKKAAVVNFDDLRADLRKLQRQLDGCSQQSLKILENSTPENIQPFKDKITIFLEQSIKQMATEFDNVEECHKQFIATMEFYLFKPKIGTLETFSPNSFFELWLPFCEDFKNIFKKEIMRLEKEKIQEIKRKEHERTAQVKKIKERENGLKAKIKRTKEKLQTNT